MDVKNIIIEGCDGTGKTTLCKKLAERYGWDIVHVTSKDPNDFDFYRQTMRKTNVVFDRHFIGEMIYPQIYNRKGNLDRHDLEYFIHQSYKEKCPVIVLTTDLEEIHRRLSVRGEEKFVAEKIETINKQFLSIALKYGLQVFDTAQNSFEEICGYIENWGTMKDFVQRGGFALRTTDETV